jgi:DNA repair exonuclease SbcCD ATPase subunit
MKILKLEWRNIFSYGDDITSIDFGDEGKLWQLSGKSGAGKSSLLSIPKLLLFGKTEGSDGKPVSVNEVANRINKKGWIRGTISKENDIYVVERTFSPSGLTIYKNEENLDVAGLKNMQGIIDSEILDGMPYHIFANVMTLSLNNFKSFISMSPADKRLIIDKIFSLEIINKVYELVKKDKKELGNSINISNSQIYSLEQTIRTSEVELASLSEKNDDNSQAQLDEIKKKLEKVAELYNSQNEIYADLYKQYTDVMTAENRFNQLINQENVEIRQINQKIALFNEDKCPTCGTPFNSEEFQHLRDELNENLIKHQEAVEGYKMQISSMSETKSTIYSNLSTVQDNINKINAKKNELLVSYQSIEAAAKMVSETSSIQKIIDSTTESKTKLEETIKDSNEQMKLLDVMEMMYSADGIKQTMMSNYIPTLNKEIEETLSFLGFPYSLTFDNNFDPHLQHLSIDIKPQSLSTGEHKKVDLTVLCSLLKMLKRKYPQINLVCLDEAVSSLDYESSAEIIKYLREISSTMNMNIFIVSHTQLDENLFDEHLYVEKQAEYSVLKKL